MNQRKIRKGIRDRDATGLWQRPDLAEPTRGASWLREKRWRIFEAGRLVKTGVGVACT